MTKHIWNMDLDETQIEYVYPLMYKSLMLEVDAIDNGIEIAEDPKYAIKTGLSTRVGRLNPSFGGPNFDPNAQHIQFKKAMMIAEEELAWKLESLT